MIKDQLLQTVCQVENYLCLSPILTSVGPIPFSQDNRILFSHPPVFRQIIKALADKMHQEKLKVDFLVGAETAGIPIAAALSLETDIPFIYVHKKRKQKGNMSFGQGDFEKGSVACLIDDVISAGRTKKLLINNLQEEGIKVCDILVIWAVSAHFWTKEWGWIRRNGLRLHYLFTMEELTSAQIKYRGLSPQLGKTMLDFVRFPETWQGNNEKWRKYIHEIEKLNIKPPKFISELL